MIEVKDIELLDAQTHKNMAIIPIKTPTNYKLDILTLKKGFELGLVEVKELETSTVNTLVVKNNSVSPLLLIEGEEIIGGDQNRIVNASILIGPESEMKVPVNCTEQGRWGYKHEFKQSEYIANYETRLHKSRARFNNMDEQTAVWDSIKSLENRRSFASPTQAMAESYDAAKTDLNDIAKSFKTVAGQTGVLIMVDGKVRGFEIFFSPDVYSQFHEKILKSYLIDCELTDDVFTINVDYVKSVIDDAVSSKYTEKPGHGLEECFEFKNDDGIGIIYIYGDELLHLSYLAGDEKENEIMENPIDNGVLEY